VAGLQCFTAGAARHNTDVFDLTNRANAVAIVTDGTRVLGLGNIGPEAGLPVMEGKALLFKYLGDVDAFPICLATQEPDELVRTVELLEPSFGGVNRRQCAAPMCASPSLGQAPMSCVQSGFEPWRTMRSSSPAPTLCRRSGRKTRKPQARESSQPGATISRIS